MRILFYFGRVCKILPKGFNLVIDLTEFLLLRFDLYFFSALFPEKFFLDSEFGCFDHKFSRLTINFPENII